VPARSESASSRWTVPRWVFVAWLWAIVGYGLLDYFDVVCSGWRPDWSCRLWSATSWVLGLLPANLDQYAGGFIQDKSRYLVAIMLAAAILTLGAVRFLPRRLSVRTSVILIASWYGLTLAPDAIWLLRVSGARVLH
jgi:hypothetical protein